MTWNNDKIEKLKKIAEKANAYIWLYDETAELYGKLNFTLSLVAIIGNYVLGSIGIPVNLLEPSAVKILNIVLQFLIIILGIIGTVHKTLNLNTKISNYKLMSFRYSTLSVLIQNELSKSNSEKTNFSEFYEQVMANESQLLKEKMYIPSRIFKNYVSRMGDKALSYSDLSMNDIIIDPSNSGDKMKSLEKYV